MDFTMYDTLLQLPLFQGLGKNDITEMVTNVKFHFKKYAVGEYLFRQGEPCNEVCFLISGRLMAETVSDNRNYQLVEEMPVPSVIELYSLFGLRPYYHSSYKAATEVSTLNIDKKYLFEVLAKYLPCGFNFVNIVCQRSQYLYRHSWEDVRGGLRERFVHFLIQRCRRVSGYKLLRIKMEELAILLGDRRINVSRMLNALQQEELVFLKRKEIEIPHLEKLL